MAIRAEQTKIVDVIVFCISIYVVKLKRASARRWMDLIPIAKLAFLAVLLS